MDLKWNEEARLYPDYYILDWQIDQCQSHGIPLIPYGAGGREVDYEELERVLMLLEERL